MSHAHKAMYRPAETDVIFSRGHRPMVVLVPTKLPTKGEAEADHLRVPAYWPIAC